MTIKTLKNSRELTTYGRKGNPFLKDYKQKITNEDLKWSQRARVCLFKIVNKFKYDFKLLNLKIWLRTWLPSCIMNNFLQFDYKIL